jgi:hypothetical protein
MPPHKIRSTVIGLLLNTLMTAPSASEPPLYAGYTGTRLALETRINNELDITEIAKTFPSNVPVWAYAGISSTSDTKPFYGLGVALFTKKSVHMLPTLEGSGDRFTNIAVYTTLDLPRSTYLDLVPSTDKNLKPASITFTPHADILNLSAGVTDTYANGSFGQASLRLAKFWKQANASITYAPSTRTGYLSGQVNIP